MPTATVTKTLPDSVDAARPSPIITIAQVIAPAAAAGRYRRHGMPAAPVVKATTVRPSGTKRPTSTALAPRFWASRAVAAQRRRRASRVCQRRPADRPIECTSTSPINAPAATLSSTAGSDIDPVVVAPAAVRIAASDGTTGNTLSATIASTRRPYPSSPIVARSMLSTVRMRVGHPTWCGLACVRWGCPHR